MPAKPSAQPRDRAGPLALALGQAIALHPDRSTPTTDLPGETPLSGSDLFSDDYLSLTHDPTLRVKALERLSETELIMGSGGSRLTSGNTSAHVAFETRMKDFFGAPAALLCNSGYDASVAFWGSIPQLGDVIIFDELLHAGTRDVMAESHAKDALYSFKHNSVISFRACVLRVLAEHSEIAAGRATVFVAVESLYDMDGDFAPVREIVQVTDALVPPKCSHILVDETHSTGLYGPQGRGIVSMLGLTERIDTVLHTFNKARAASGAVLLTSAIVRQYIINHDCAFIFTTSMPGASVAILDASFDHIGSHTGDQARKRLGGISKRFHGLLHEALESIPRNLLSLRPRCIPADFPDNVVSPIFPILTEHPLWLAAYLRHFGYACKPVLYPAVPRGEEGIRIVVHASNEPAELREFINHMLDWAESMQA